MNKLLDNTLKGIINLTKTFGSNLQEFGRECEKMNRVMEKTDRIIELDNKWIKETTNTEYLEENEY